MKKLITLSLLASALLLTTSAGNAAPPAPERAPVLRKMKAVGRVRKFAVKISGDKLGIEDKEVCRFEVDLPVYDLRNRGAWDYAEVAECKSEVGGKPVRVHISAYAAETLWSNLDGSTSEAKIAQASLSVRAVNGDSNHGIIDLDGYQGTKDLSSSSFLLFLSQAYQPGQSPVREEFSATLELQDQR